MSKETYYNFPIHLLKGFLIDSDKCLNDIILYSVYVNSLNIESGTELERVELTLKSFGLSGNVKEICKSAAKIYTNTPAKSAMSGINSKIIYDYRTNFKTDFDKVCLLAFLAIKSIIANKAYCKIDNNFLWSRMDGNTKSVDVSELSDEVKVYANRYQIDKIKKELEEKYGFAFFFDFVKPTLNLTPFWVIFTGEHHPFRCFSIDDQSPRFYA